MFGYRLIHKDDLALLLAGARAEGAQCELDAQRKAQTHLSYGPLHQTWGSASDNIAWGPVTHGNSHIVPTITRKDASKPTPEPVADEPLPDVVESALTEWPEEARSVSAGFARSLIRRGMSPEQVAGIVAQGEPADRL